MIRILSSLGGISRLRQDAARNQSCRGASLHYQKMYRCRDDLRAEVLLLWDLRRRQYAPTLSCVTACFAVRRYLMVRASQRDACPQVYARGRSTRRALRMNPNPFYALPQVSSDLPGK